MQVRVLSEADREKWNSFVSSQKDPQVLQSWEWGQFKSKQGWDHFVIVVEDGNGIKAGISILSRKLPIIKKALFYAPRGPICDLNDSETFDKLIDGICVEASLRNALALKIDPEIEQSGSGAVEKLIQKGFIRKKKQVQPRSTFFVDLSRSENDIMMSFEEKTRYNIRLAEKKGVKVSEESTVAGIENFYKLYEETCKRDNFLIHPRTYYTRLKDLLIEKGMANVFTAKFRGIPVASVYVFRFGDRVWYMYGASANAYRNVMPNHALHWHVIKWAREKGYKTYDLWGVPADPHEKHPLYGVWRFKKGFNGQARQWVGVYDLPFSNLLYGFFDKGLEIYKAVRSLLTKGKISDSLSE